MGTGTVRGNIAIRVLISHVCGLCVSGISDTIGTTSGFSIEGAGLGLFLGGLLSLPWLIALGALIWFQSRTIETHPVIFAVFGPAVVSGSWALLAGGFFREVAISSVASSLIYLLLVLGARLLNAHREELFQ